MKQQSSEYLLAGDSLVRELIFTQCNVLSVPDRRPMDVLSAINYLNPNCSTVILLAGGNRFARPVKNGTLRSQKAHIEVITFFVKVELSNRSKCLSIFYFWTYSGFCELWTVELNLGVEAISISFGKLPVKQKYCQTRTSFRKLSFSEQLFSECIYGPRHLLTQ